MTDTDALAAEMLAGLEYPLAWDLVANDGANYLLRGEDGIEPQGWKSSTPIYSVSPASVRALLSERAAMKAELTRLREGVDTLIESLTSLSGGAYCRSLEQLSKTECLGEEYKLKNGLFGAAELSGHRKAAELLGQHIGMASAVRAIKAALKGASHD